MSDLIERDAAINEIVAWTVEDRPDVEMPTDLIDRIKALPSAQRWIPFRAEKPKGGQQILACSEDGVMWMTAYSALNNLTGAWMPLPEPYKE